MKLSFSSKKLEKELTNEAAMKRAYGNRASRLKMRLDLLRAAPTLADVPIEPPPRRHQLGAEWAGHYAVDITGKNWRLIFKPDHDPVPTLASGGVDLKAITAVEIVLVKDYH